jgi:hypothetical protein
MRSALRGRSTSATEVTSVSTHGVWLWLGDREAFLPYERFPWFREASIGQVLNVKRVTESHLHWPELDVDLHVESIAHPEDYPLVSKLRPNKRMQPARARTRRPSVRSRARG